MSAVRLDPAAMAWLAKKGAATRVHKAVDHFLTNSAGALPALGKEGAEMLQHMANALVASGVIMELGRQLQDGQRMDPTGLGIVRRYLRDYPNMLPHLQAQARAVKDPNHREMFNTLLARAQAA